MNQVNSVFKSEKPFHLTEVQMAYLLGRGSNLELRNVSTHYYIEVETKLDIKKVNKALNKLILRHPMMRCIFLSDRTQMILDEVPEYSIESIVVQPGENVEGVILEERNRMSHYVFQPDEWPLFEIKSVKNSPETNYMFFSLDLLFADAVSIHVIISELLLLCEDEKVVLPEINIEFKKFIDEYESTKNNEKYLADKEYWMNKIPDFFPSAPIPLIRESSRVVNPQFDRLKTHIDKESWEAIRGKCKELNVRPTALLCTAYAMVLSYWSNQSDLSFSLTVSNRRLMDSSYDNVVGDFTSLLMLDFKELSARKSFFEKINMVNDSLTEALEHSLFDGIEVIREISKYNNYVNKAVMPVVLTSLTIQ